MRATKATNESHKDQHLSNPSNEPIFVDTSEANNKAIN